MFLEIQIGLLNKYLFIKVKVSKNESPTTREECATF